MLYYERRALFALIGLRFAVAFRVGTCGVTLRRAVRRPGSRIRSSPSHHCTLVSAVESGTLDDDSSRRVAAHWSYRTYKLSDTVPALNRTRRSSTGLSPGSGLLTAPLGHRLTLPTTAMRRADTCDTTQLAGTHIGTYSSLLSAMACGSRVGSVGAVSSILVRALVSKQTRC